MPAATDHSLVITFPVPLQGAHLAVLFADPLRDALEAEGVAAVVDPGRVETRKSGEPASVSLDVALDARPTAALLKLVVEALNLEGAPRGSTVSGEAMSRPLEFGVDQVMGIYLNRRELPDEVYRQHDVNDLIFDLEGALGGDGRLVSWWEGKHETGLYFFGDRFSRMAEAVAGLVDQHPLCVLGRVVQLA